ncbi:MAG: efflux RND transporter periplasmic adaptor subunit [Gemmatimonadetes bacterium]|nr:efflux RND transporter periplasmic adaptor subunit [Gemmatimonadota bacterium]
MKPIPRKRALVAGGALLLVALAVLTYRSTGSPAAVPPSNAGSPPSAGDTVVTLDSAAQQLAGVELLTVGSGSRSALTVNGSITFDAERVSVIAPRAEGRLLRMQADLGQQVAPGQVLAVVESPEIGQIRGDLERARAAVDIAKRNYEREKRLFEQNISPQKEMLDAELLYRTAEADGRSAAAKLETYGATAGHGGSYGLSSAVAGTVVERNGSPGQIVGPTTNVFTVADLHHVWIIVDVYEADFTQVRPGADVIVTPVAFPGESFRGTVRLMGGVVDTASHTFKIRVVVENPDRRLRPGMFAQVRIGTRALASTASAVSIPDIAVQDIDGRPVVFVASSTAGRFVVRLVELGPRTGDGSVVVTRGLRAGERLVVKGAFQLKAELTKASSGGGE